MGKMRNIPKGFLETIYQDQNSVIYTRETPNIVAIGFSGKRSKPDFNYGFKNFMGRKTFIDRYLKRLDDIKADKEKRKQDRLSYVHTLEVGDILVCSWGYEQTNVDFYQVVRLVGKTIAIIREIESTHLDEAGCGMSGIKMPVKDAFSGEEMVKKIGKGNYVRITSFAWASPWNGKPCRYNWYG